MSLSHSAGNSHPHSPPEVPEGGGSRHHEGGDPRGGADRGRRRDRPRRDGAEERPDPLVQRSEPHPDAGTTSAPHRDTQHTAKSTFTTNFTFHCLITGDGRAPRIYTTGVEFNMISTVSFLL